MKEFQIIRKQIVSWNRVKLFVSQSGNNYLYDAFSQNIYPISRKCSDFIFGNSDDFLDEIQKSEVISLFEKLQKYKNIHNYSRLPETHLTLNFSNKCNLNCSYCYRHKANENSMSLERAFDVIEYADKYFKVNNDEIIFSLDMTAESFLDYDRISAFEEKLEDYRNHQKCRVWFMSNGTHIAQKEIKLIKKCRINPFWISLDGPEEVHNKNRKYYNDKGSHKDVIRNIKFLQENDINVKISCVLTADYPNPDLLYKYFKSLNISAIQMCPVRNGCSSSFDDETAACLQNGYKNLFNEIFTEIQNNDFSAFRLLKEDLSMLAVVNLICRVRHSSRCTWGTEVVLDENGNMYPCLYVIGKEEYFLGNISDKKTSKEILKPIKVTELDKCHNCWARYLCGGTCHYNSIVKGKSVYETDDIECSIRKFVIEEAINLLLRLIENNIDMAKVSKAIMS